MFAPLTSIMKKILFTLGFCGIFSSLFFIGCKSSTPSESEKNPEPPISDSTSTTDYFLTLQSLIANNEPFVYLENFEINNLPRDIYDGQFYTKTAIQVGSLLFAFVEQPNMNLPVMLVLPEDAEIKWAGILISDDNGDTWKKFFTVENRPDAQATEGFARVNVVGFFAKNDTLFVDVSDARGAGSGEGQLTRYQSTDNGKKWTEEGCYYFIPDTTLEPVACP